MPVSSGDRKSPLETNFSPLSPLYPNTTLFFSFLKMPPKAHISASDKRAPLTRAGVEGAKKLTGAALDEAYESMALSGYLKIESGASEDSEDSEGEDRRKRAPRRSHRQSEVSFS